MQEEREELVKRVFPQLRKLCESRGVTWGEVDLRWGVTDEQKAEGKVLPICLDEIHRCRPYFIGLLGDRYGWICDVIPEHLLEAAPWLNRHAGKSVTELEILHGVLLHRDMATDAFFYFRDPKYLKTRPSQERAAFLAESEAAAGKLEALKQRIRRSGFPVRENYANPHALGESVLADFRRVIETRFPDATNALDRDAAEHEAYARRRRETYVARQDDFGRIDQTVLGTGAPLVVLGESGGGKSALLANWALKHRFEHPEDVVIMHFIGSSPESCDWISMLRRIMQELQRQFDVEKPIPEHPQALRLGFANLLHVVSEQIEKDDRTRNSWIKRLVRVFHLRRWKAGTGRSPRQVVIVLDGLNQLDDRQGALDLAWLPSIVPPRVHLLVSTLEGRSLDALRQRECSYLTVGPLTDAERGRFIAQYLARYGKQMDSAQQSLVVSAEQTRNPLYLSTLLEELRLFGSHSGLDAQLRAYLDTQTPSELYRKVLVRWERDFGSGTGLVQRAMSLLWAARRGLSEAELLDLLGENGTRLPGAQWSPLYLASEQALLQRDGLIAFGHDFLRQAVESTWLSGVELRAEAHRAVANYFAGRALGPRQLQELPWQLAEAREWQRLYDLLANVTFFAAAWGESEFDVKEFWARIEAGSDLQMDQGYAAVTASPGSYNPTHLWHLGTLLNDTGHLAEALSLRAHLVRRHRAANNQRELANALCGEAIALRAQGNLDAAMSRFLEEATICNALGDQAGLAVSLGNRALILMAQKDLQGALALHRQEEQICRALDHRSGLAISLGNQALILVEQADLDGAAALHKQEEDIYRELGDKVGMQFSRVNQGAVLQKRGDLDGAMALYRATEQGCRELGDSEGVATSLANQAWVCGLEREEFDRAIALAEQALLISSSHGYRSLSRDITTILERIEARRSVHSPGSSTRNV